MAQGHKGVTVTLPPDAYPAALQVPKTKIILLLTDQLLTSRSITRPLGRSGTAFHCIHYSGESSIPTRGREYFSFPESDNKTNRIRFSPPILRNVFFIKRDTQLC